MRPARTVLVVLTALIGTGVVVAPSASALDCSALRITGHRGSPDASHTENTIASALQAVSRGADAVEGDMRQTSDGVWVVMHDATVDRTTDGTGAVADLTAAQVADLTTDDGVHGGVPTVQALVEAVKAVSPTARLELEIKATRLSHAALNSLLRLFTDEGVRSRLTITSFHGRPLLAVREVSTSWHTGLITRSRVTTAKARKYARSLMISGDVLSASYVHSMHKAHVKVFGWPADDRATWDRLLPTGVDGITTDDVASATTWCG